MSTDTKAYLIVATVLVSLLPIYMVAFRIVWHAWPALCSGVLCAP